MAYVMMKMSSIAQNLRPANLLTRRMPLNIIRSRSADRKKRLAVALVGGDGAGKTTIARKLLQCTELPMKYVYMGFSTRSSNFALPTSRLVLLLKQSSYRAGRKKGPYYIPSEQIPASHLEYGPAKRGVIRALGRFVNRLAEALYRQIISLGYQMRGYVVVYDRHFLFDSACEIMTSQTQQEDRFDRIYYWIMRHWFPKPDLAIFLDAPAEVLYERKQDTTPDQVKRQREAFLELAKRLSNFVKVDASQPLDKVFSQVRELIMNVHASRQFRASKRCQELSGGK